MTPAAESRATGWRRSSSRSSRSTALARGRLVAPDWGFLSAVISRLGWAGSYSSRASWAKDLSSRWFFPRRRRNRGLTIVVAQYATLDRKAHVIGSVPESQLLFDT